MKFSFFLASLLVAHFSASSSLGQINDDEDSYGLLAVQCLISAQQAGRTDVSLASYDKYATSLAKTISALSPEQQSRVFDGVSSGGPVASDSNFDSLAAKANSEELESSSSGFLSSLEGAVVNGVGSLNAFFSGESDVAPTFSGTVKEAGKESSVASASAFEDPPGFAAQSASTPVDSEVGDVAAVVDEVIQGASVALPQEAPPESSFDFWSALKKFFEGVIDFFDGDGGSQYEEYQGN